MYVRYKLAKLEWTGCTHQPISVAMCHPLWLGLDVTIRTEIRIHVAGSSRLDRTIWLHEFLQSWISAVLSEASAVQGVDGCLQRAKPAGPATGCCCNIGALRCRPELCTPFAAAWTRKSETGKLHFLSFSCASAFNVVFGREMGDCKPADALGICAPSRGLNRIRRCAWRFRKCAESNRSISS